MLPAGGFVKLELYVVLVLILLGGIALFCRSEKNRCLPFILILTVTVCVLGLLCSVSGLVYSGADALPALFRIPVYLTGGLAAVHSRGYLAGERRYGMFLFFFNCTLAAMLAVTYAETAVSFLVAWELMGVLSFALVAYEYHEKAVQKAAWIYLLACHAGAVFLIPAFILGDGAFCGGVWTTLPLLLGLAGFGLKAGFPLLHVWLPEAHPAAPAPVSAVMSGAMINLGFYGILRMPYQTNDPFSLQLLGWILLICGIIGALGGVLFALAQQNLKRLLAYSSIENMGIIGMGLGLGFLCAAEPDFKWISFFGFAGAFLHILNHAVLKGTLFLCAGSVLKATGTLNMDKFGGLQKRMPYTGSAFLYSSFALSGLPPFNGFIGEFMIYAGAVCCITNFAGANVMSPGLLTAGLLILPVLALTGALAAAAFVKASAATFLGEPRTDAAANALERPFCMRLPLLAGVIFSFVLLVAAPCIVDLVKPVMERLTGAPLPGNAVLLEPVTGISVILIVLACGLILIRRLLPRGKAERIAPTWDCGYAKPTARMEYTGTAFVQPLTDFFANLICLKKNEVKPDGLFPVHAEISVETEDAADKTVWHPLFRFFGRLSDKIHHLQSGYLHLYILIMVLALLFMLVWAFLPELTGGNSTFHFSMEVFCK